VRVSANADPKMQRLVDLEEIRQLNARYNHAMDARNRDAYAACLTPDAQGGRYGTDIRQNGREAITEMAVTFPVEGRHMCTDTVVEIDGDEATQKIYCLYLDMGPPFDVSMFGLYHDKLVRTSEGWKFSQRFFQPFYLRPSEVTLKNIKPG
jgi:hypothetical protein